MMQQTVATAVAREEIVGVREMASLTKVNPSSVSRYVQRYPELGVRLGGETKVRRDAYLAHRGNNPTVDAETLPEEDPSPAPLRAAAVEAGLPGREAKARHDAVRAELAEMELAERKGELVRVSDVQRLIADAGQRLRDELLAPQIDFAERLKACDTPREAAAMLVERNRAILTAFADRLAAEG